MHRVEKNEPEKVAEETKAPEVDDSEAAMMAAMGVPVGFDSTKGKKVAGADVSFAKVKLKLRHRQYMNRKCTAHRNL